ncbi:MAG TPA: hypothetical protein VIM69_12290 [Opitutaceae bacterium]
MNEPNSSVPPSLPPQSEIAVDLSKSLTLLGAVEAVLRNPRQIIERIASPQAPSTSLILAMVATVSSIIYGVVVGSFSGGVQWWAAPAKITVGMALSSMICLPSLYIFACLGGSRARPAEVVGILMAMLAIANLLLIGFAPVAWIFSQSTDSISCVGFFHVLFWVFALLLGCRFISTALRTLGSHSTSLVGLWALIFLFVTLQMTTTLRPIVGTSPQLLPNEKLFFLNHWFQDSPGKSAR